MFKSWLNGNCLCITNSIALSTGHVWEGMSDGSYDASSHLGGSEAKSRSPDSWVASLNPGRGARYLAEAICEEGAVTNISVARQEIFSGKLILSPPLEHARWPSLIWHLHSHNFFLAQCVEETFESAQA